MKDDDTFGAGSYPTPPEPEEQTVKARVYVSFDIEYDVPLKWNNEDIYNDIEENIKELEWDNFKIDEIEL